MSRADGAARSASAPRVGPGRGRCSLLLDRRSPAAGECCVGRPSASPPAPGRSRRPPGRRRRPPPSVGGRLVPSVDPAISSPISSGRVPAGTSPMILPRYITAIRSARPSTSSSSVETSTTAVPRSRSATIRRCTNSIEPTSRPRVGCGHDQQLQRPGQLAGEHDLLLVAAGQRAGARRVDRRGAHVELLDPLAGVARDRGSGRSDRPVRERRLVVQVEDQVLGDGEVADQAVVQPVLGHVADARARGRRRWTASVMSAPGES